MSQQIILKYALQNAVRYDGNANPGAIIGKVLAENPELRSKVKELSKEIKTIVKEVNKLSKKEQEEKLKNLDPSLLEKKQEKKKDIFEFLHIKEGAITTAFPPEPSKYPHIGHAKAILINYELAKKYSGKFILRFEDTNPKLAEKEFYKIHIDNYEWLGINPDEISYASDHLEEFYKYAEKLIKENFAYVCSCPQEIIKEKRFKGEECLCRYILAEENMERWQKMPKAKEGRYILRLKIEMQHKNTSMRDPALMRIIDCKHARTGKKYRLWPTYDFENSVMDGIQNITHRLRSKEFEMRNELQRYIQNRLNFKETKIYEFARFNLEGVESSGRIIREKISKKELVGWDDPSLTTLVALKRRGFLPKAIREFVLSTGITKTESVLTWDDLIIHNKRLLDPECNRYFFIESPKEITIEKAPEQDVELNLHPEFKEKGIRKFKVQDKFLIEESDYKELENNKVYRLMDCLNFTKKKNKFIFHSLEYGQYKKQGHKIIHWLPNQKDLVKVEILMPDKEIKNGLAEPLVKKLNVDGEIQFERKGFCRLDKKEKNKLKFWFSHK
ncbi:glutamate--tRNA ligase [Candidatus Woesearchaeota archaeon]|nr:glutamate--tRNA ligase [Candidatus Woesearchaeota archaeon]